MWEPVREGLEDIKRLCGEKWEAEAIRGRLLQGGATLFVFRNPEIVGFCVLEQCFEPLTSIPFVNAWLLHFVNGVTPVRAELLEFLDACARQGGGEIRFSSPRLGWMRFLKDDFEVKATIFVRKVK